MENMDDLLDNIISDESPSQISDAIKDMLYSKTAERVDAYKQTASNALFNGNSEEETVSDDEVETSDGV
jgi:hypothetical protein|tara:strand:+ start:4837 stop:5043 length:207 start_codon:yes stop_codon:yes gene_type:complete